MRTVLIAGGHTGERTPGRRGDARDGGGVRDRSWRRRALRAGRGPAAPRSTSTKTAWPAWPPGSIGTGWRPRSQTSRATTTSCGWSHAAVGAFGRLDVAVNGAVPGPLSTRRRRCEPETGVSFCDQPTGHWAEVVDVGLVAPFRCIKHEARQMVAQGGGGAIINIASINSRQPADGMSSYCSAKAGRWRCSRGARRWSSARIGIRVTAIGPGLIDTPMTSFLTTDPSAVGGLCAQHPPGSARHARRRRGRRRVPRRRRGRMDLRGDDLRRRRRS